MEKNTIDYSTYEMSVKEKMIGYVAGAAAAFIAIQIFFGYVILSGICAVAAGFVGIKIYRQVLKKKRDNVLLIQFRDMLGSVSTSIGSGKNVVNSFNDAYQEMQNQFGDSSYIANELKFIITGLQNNITIENLLMDFGERSAQEDIQSFAEVFSVANRRGGSIRQIILDTKNVISDKISVELEIQTLISGKKNELNIMILLPLIVVSQVNTMMAETSGFDIITFIVKIVAIAMFVFAYFIGQKIMDIRV
ncbi:MAG: kinase [Lachnospiraceae bacterium]|nr:kinase [Lachnospiraceae bacterium]